MNNKKIFLLLIFLLLFVLPFVSAHEANDMLDVSDDNIYSVSDAREADLGDNNDSALEVADGTGNTFTDLNILINNHDPSTGPLNLDKDYIFDSDTDDSLKDGIEINKEITINGNGFTLNANKRGRIFNVKNSGVVLNNIKFINGNSEKGGAIYCDDKVTVSDSTFINNSAMDGGAIFTKDSTIDNCKFYENAANSRGGGLFSEGKSSVTNCVFDNNNITNYKRIENLNIGGAAIFSTGELEMNHTNITNNLKDYVERGYVNSYLGMGAVTFTNNTKISNSIFENNNGCYGGAISSTVNFNNPSDYKFDIDNVIFKNNRGYDGGAIYVGTSNSNLGKLFAENIIFTINNSKFEENSAGYVGNPGYTAGGGAICVVDNHGYGNITSSNFTKNYAHSHQKAAGGALSFQDTHLNIDDCIFSQNYANKGGAIEFSKIHNSPTDAIISNSKFDNNVAKTMGGGAIYYASGNLTLINSNLTDNKAVNNKGGAIYHAGDLKVLISDFTKNTADDGGAITSINVKNLEIDNSNFDENVALKTYGGALYSFGTVDGVVFNSNFTKNNANNGGAVFAYSCSKLNIDSTNFDNNDATTSGGAIYALKNTNIDINNSNFNENKANNYGGAVYASTNTNLRMTDTNFNENYVTTYYGGAVYANTVNNLDMEGTNFTGNHAARGGAIYSTGAATVANISDSYFNKNIASYGSAIFVFNGKLYIADTEFGKNRANSASLDLDVPKAITYYPSNITANVIFKGCDNIANAIWSNVANTGVYLSNITYEVYIKGKHYNKTTPVGYINPVNGADENAEVWKDSREDTQLINFIITPLTNPNKVIVNETVLTDVYGDISKIFKNIEPGVYTITAQHLLDDYYTYISNSATFIVLDLKVNKTTKDVNVLVRDNVTYTVEVSNAGAKNLSDITIVECVPDGFSLLDYSKDWKIVGQSGNNITFKYIGNNGILEGKQTIDLNLTFKASKPGKFSNTVYLSSNETSQRQANSSNEVNVNPIKLNIVETNNSTYNVVGDLVTITINVTNEGPLNASYLNITDVIGDDLKIHSVSNESLVDYTDDNKVIWIIPDVDIGETVTVSIVVEIKKSGSHNDDTSAKSQESEVHVTSTEIFARKIPTHVTIGSITTFAGEEVSLPIKVTSDDGVPFNGNVTVSLPDGSKRTVPISNGKGNVKWFVPENFSPKKYNVNVKVDGDDKYDSSSGKGVVTVIKIPVDITVGKVTAKPGEEITIPIKVKTKDKSVFNGNVTVTLPDGTKKVVEIINGKGSINWTIPKNYNGDYDVVVDYDGNTHYYESTGKGLITVIPEDIKSPEENKSVNYNPDVKSDVIHPTGNPIFLLICVFALLVGAIKRRK